MLFIDLPHRLRHFYVYLTCFSYEAVRVKKTGNQLTVCKAVKIAFRNIALSFAVPYFEGRVARGACTHYFLLSIFSTNKMQS